MPIVIAVFGILATAYTIYMRTRGAARAASDLANVVGDVGLATRRFRFRQKSNLHPVESITDPKVAVAGIAAAFVELEGLPTQDLRNRLTIALAQQLGLTSDSAEELAVFGRWMVEQCGTPGAAVTRLSRKLYRLSGTGAVTPLLGIINTTLQPASGALNTHQSEALTDISNALRIRT